MQIPGSACQGKAPLPTRRTSSSGPARVEERRTDTHAQTPYLLFHRHQSRAHQSPTRNLSDSLHQYPCLQIHYHLDLRIRGVSPAPTQLPLQLFLSPMQRYHQGNFPPLIEKSRHTPLHHQKYDFFVLSGLSISHIFKRTRTYRNTDCPPDCRRWSHPRHHAEDYLNMLPCTPNSK